MTDTPHQSHDHNFKNLILDYPRQAIALCAPTETADMDDPQLRILPVREEQLKERLGERFRELDVPLLVEWPDKRRAALLFLFEEESRTRRFNIHRLAHYCLDISELLDMQRIVPVVIFLRGGDYDSRLRLGSDHTDYLNFHFLAFELREQQAADYFDSPNLIARLNLPNMRYARRDKVRVYAQAVSGLLTLEPDPDCQIKYLDFIDIYAQLNEDERMQYQQHYAQDAAVISGFAQRFIDKGVQQGEVRLLLRQLTARFGALPEPTRERVAAADAETLLVWSERVLSATSLDEVFGDS